MSSDTVTEIAAGSFSGVIQVLVGQPFDTIKVRLQSGSQAYKSTLDCLQQTVRQEGSMALYKGTLSPLMGIAFCTSIQFSTLEEMKRRFKTMNGSDSITPGQFYVAGAVAGLANSVVSGPVEHIRTRMQVQSSGSAAAYSSTLDCFKKIYSAHGVRGIYKGQATTMLREWQGFGGYFFVYEMLVQNATKGAGIRVSDLPTWKVMLFGAMAGYGMWLPVYPIDVIKSKLQTDSIVPAKQRYKGFMDCLRKVVQAEGAAGLYRGFTACMLRAGPVNAATFAAYELAMNVLKVDR